MGDSAGRLAITALGGFLIKPVQLGLSIGSLIGGLLFPNRRPQRPARFENLQVSTAQKGNPIPIVYGTQRVPGTLLWYGNFQRNEQSQGSKGGGKGGSPPDPEVRYSASFIYGVCEGPISDIPKIWAGKDPIDMSLEGTKFSIYTGTAGQTADPDISGVMSGTGTTQIFTESITPPASGTVSDKTTTSAPVSSGSVSLYYFYKDSGGNQLRASYSTVVTTPGADQYWLVDNSLGTFRVGWPANSPSSNLQLQYTRTGTQSVYGLPYRNTAYVAFKSWDLGASATIPNFTFEVNGLNAAVTGVFSDDFNRVDSQTLGQSWVEFEFSGSRMQVASNQLLMTAGFGEQNWAWYDDSYGAASQYSQLHHSGDLTALTGGLITTGVRMAGAVPGGAANPNSLSGYIAGVKVSGGPTFELRRVDGNIGAGSALLASVTMGTWAVNRIRLQADGGTLYASVVFSDGTVTKTLTTIDSTYTTGNVGVAVGGIGAALGETYWTNWIGGGSGLLSAGGDINPVQALNDFLVNDRYGAGVASSRINSASWDTIKSYVDSQDLLVSPIIGDRARTLDHAEHLLSYFDGLLVYTQGEYKLKARRVESAVTSLTDADYVEAAR